jgi:ADP-ribosylglycohydrolase
MANMEDAVMKAVAKKVIGDIDTDTIVVIVGGKKVDPKKVKIKLTEDV